MVVTMCRLYRRFKGTSRLGQGMSTSLYRVTSRSKAAFDRAAAAMFARKLHRFPLTPMYSLLRQIGTDVNKDTWFGNCVIGRLPQHDS